MKHASPLALVALLFQPLFAAEYHVSPKGDDANKGTASSPLKTISAAARLAEPGDTVTVHAGVYRERVSPPRGGESDAKRIVYQAAPGEKVVVKGSEPIKGWEKVQNDTWKATIPNRLFGDFNPYVDVIRGDWFGAKGREHHTGAVYLNGHWLTESPNLDQVLKPVADQPLWNAGDGQTLLNVAWIRPATASQETGRIPAASYAAQQGVQKAPCSEGGECIGWIEHGDWVRYDRVEFKQPTDLLELRVASETAGGIIEIRLDSPEGELLGKRRVSNTGGWQSWVSYKAGIKPVEGVKTLCLVFKSPQSDSPAKNAWRKQDTQLWFAKVDDANTTIWAQFPDVDPNKADVEINVRRAVFYPEKTGMNYITVRGFTMMHAATNWVPPTAEQVGLIGTNWSKGWIIEDCDVSYSTCVGITLGKHGDEFDNTSANSAEGYVKTIERGHARGWSKENIGHHLVRNNHISHCEQAGLVGSLGAVFSKISGNVIHDIHVRRLFTGAEMAGIKIHAAIDTEISGNHIFRTCRGIWLDWMTQGTRVTGNLFHDNGPAEDLMVEVNHGPFLVDNNIFLSPVALFDMSQGGAYVHNLFTGRLGLHPELGRETPFHKAHSTEVVGLRKIPGGDSRFYNNIFVGPAGLESYDKAAFPMFLGGNVFVKGAKACKAEGAPLVAAEFDPAVKLVEGASGMELQITLDKAWAEKGPRPLVTTELLGKAKIPDLPFERPDGSPYRIDRDYFGKPRGGEQAPKRGDSDAEQAPSAKRGDRAEQAPSAKRGDHPFPGPFQLPAGGKQVRKVWPVATPR